MKVNLNEMKIKMKVPKIKTKKISRNENTNELNQEEIKSENSTVSSSQKEYKAASKSWRKNTLSIDINKCRDNYLNEAEVYEQVTHFNVIKEFLSKFLFMKILMNLMKKQKINLPRILFKLLSLKLVMMILILI